MNFDIPLYRQVIMEVFGKLIRLERKALYIVHATKRCILYFVLWSVSTATLIKSF